MPTFVQGGLHEVSISDGTTTVSSTAIHEDFEYSEEIQSIGLSDGQQAQATVLVEVVLFLLDLSSTDAAQLRTWSDNETRVYATLGGMDYTVHLADQMILIANEQRSGQGEISGTRIHFQMER